MMIDDSPNPPFDATPYQVTLDPDTGTYTAITHEGAHRLLDDALRCAAQVMLRYADSPHFSDDDTDYMRAASDQISQLTDARCADDEADTQQMLLAILNYQETDIYSDHELDAQAFLYGYADHFSPISELARMNWE